MTPCLAPHQSEAVERLISLLDRWGGALLADDVGLGKSWIAAEVARRLSMRVELIVPRALLSQWRILLRQFDLDAELITHDSLPGKSTMPGEGDPRLLIVDEAHRFRNPVTNRYRALALRSAGRPLLLVTATPICNRLDDLYALVRLITCDDALAGRGVLSIQMAFESGRQEWLDTLIEERVVRRSREVLSEPLQFGTLRREVIRFPAAGESALREFLSALQFPLIAAASGQAEILRQLLWRRLESSPAALLDSILRQKRFYHRARESLSQGLELSKRDYRRIFGDDEDELFFQDVMFRELWSGQGLANQNSIPLVDGEIRRLNAVETVVRQSVDRKCQLLLEAVEQAHPEPTLIFTAAVATAREIFRVLQDRVAAGLLSSRLRWSRRHRRLTFDQVLDSFRSGEIRVLVLTDLGAEGLNLQNAGVVIHYDIPWNPVRIDQRNGRIHRIGQERDVVRAIYFLPERRSQRVVMRAVASKNRVRRSVLHPSREGAPHAPRAEDLRPRVGRLDATAVLFQRLVRERLITDEVLDLLARRYRSGAELVIRQMSSEFLDPQRVRYLVDLLTRERETCSS